MRTKPAKSTHPERIEVQIPAEIGVQLREYANRKGRSLSDVVAHAVKNFLKVADPKRREP